MHITVAICTWNRAKLLDQTLLQMQSLRIPEGVTWEVLVVNNNSTDNTDAVIARYSDALPLRRLLETKQGHSNARNCAIANATGELLLWTDDDVLVDPEWLAAYAEAAREFPEAVLFGGNIEPWYEQPPAAWVSRHLERVGGAYAIRKSGTHGELITEANYPFGANMGFRLSVAKEYLFDPELGRCGKGMRSGDETDVIRRVLRAGLTGRWVPAAEVRHYVVAQRLTPSYVYEFFRGISETDTVMGLADGAGPLPFPWWCVRRWCEMTARRAFHSRVRDEQWLSGLLGAARVHGIISGWRYLVKRSKTSPPPVRAQVASRCPEVTK